MSMEITVSDEMTVHIIWRARFEMFFLLPGSFDSQCSVIELEGLLPTDTIDKSPN